MSAYSDIFDLSQRPTLSTGVGPYKMFKVPVAASVAVSGSVALISYGQGAPSNGTDGYAPACTYIDRTNGIKYTNTGTGLLSVWSADSTATSATVAFTGAVTTTDGVASGGARKVGGTQSVAVAAGTSLTASASEAVLLSYSIPANTIKAGTVIKVTAMARVTADTGATTLTGRLRFGTTTLTGTVLAATSAVDNAAGYFMRFEYILVGRAAPGAAAAVTGSGSYAIPGAAATAMAAAYLTPTNFATNGALLIEITGQFNASDANAVQGESLVVEIIG